MSAIAPLVAHSLRPFSTYPPSTGVAVAASRAGSEPTSGSVSRNALILSLATSGSHLRFCSSVPNRRSGSATPIDWCALSSVESEACHTPASARARL